jgi:hypothetical protein
MANRRGIATCAALGKNIGVGVQRAQNWPPALVPHTTRIALPSRVTTERESSIGTAGFEPATPLNPILYFHSGPDVESRATSHVSAPDYIQIREWVWRLLRRKSYPTYPTPSRLFMLAASNGSRLAPASSATGFGEPRLSPNIRSANGGWTPSLEQIAAANLTPFIEQVPS